MLTKIKHSKGETEISWKDTNDSNGESVEHKLSCSEPPRPELVAALNNFVPYVLEVCELPKDYGENLSVTGVSISYSDHLGIGIVVTSLKKVTKANSPVVVNTPFLSSDASAEGGPRWPVYVQGALEMLESEAQLYRDGKRAQQELDLRQVCDKTAEAINNGLLDGDGVTVRAVGWAELGLEADLRARVQSSKDGTVIWPADADPDLCARLMDKIQHEAQV